MKVYTNHAVENDAFKIIAIRNQCFYDDYIKYDECPANQGFTGIYLLKILLCTINYSHKRLI